MLFNPIFANVKATQLPVAPAPMMCIGLLNSSGFSMFACLEKDCKEHLDLYGCCQYVRLATEDEVKQLNEMLWVNNKKWNNETKQLENV